MTTGDLLAHIEILQPFTWEERHQTFRNLTNALDQLETEIEHLAERAGAEARESRGIALDVLREAREIVDALETHQ